MTPRFSIIIPLFNKEYLISDTIQSVLNQTWTNFELLIINDGSTDNSLNVVSSFEDDRIKVYTTKNQGVSAARNLGIKNASGYFIAFLDADDSWNKFFLESLNELINLYPNKHVFATALSIETKKGRYNATYKNLNIAPDNYDLINYFQGSLGHSLLQCVNCVISRKAIETIGLFDVTLKTNEDTDYWIRTGLKYPVVFINKVLATHRYVKDGLTHSNKFEYAPINYKEYLKLSINNFSALKFLNKNMYSSIIKLNLIGDTITSQKLNQLIDRSLLNRKQKLILALPKFVLKMVVNSYNIVTNKKRYY